MKRSRTVSSKPLSGLRISSLLGFLVFTTLFIKVSSLLCLQCMSMHDTKCIEGDVSPRQCRDEFANATYCMKGVGKEVHGRGHFVFRSCSRIEENDCSQQVQNNRHYEVCRTTCSADACNNALSVDSSSGAIILYFLPLAAALIINIYSYFP